MQEYPRSRIVVFLLVAVLGCAVDLATKSWVFARLGYPPRDVIWIIPQVLSLETSLNEGALFGVGQGFTPLFAALSLLAGCDRWTGRMRMFLEISPRTSGFCLHRNIKQEQAGSTYFAIFQHIKAYVAQVAVSSNGNGIGSIWQ